MELEFEGGPEEVNQRYEQALKLIATRFTSKTEAGKETNGKRTFKKTGEMKLLLERISLLRDEKFFDTPKDLGEIRKAMQTRGWYHTSPNIQAALLGHADELGIKRVLEGGKYKYVKT